jgi:hypothetical protein
VYVLPDIPGISVPVTTDSELSPCRKNLGVVGKPCYLTVGNLSSWGVDSQPPMTGQIPYRGPKYVPAGLVKSRSTDSEPFTYFSSTMYASVERIAYPEVWTSTFRKIYTGKRKGSEKLFTCRPMRSPRGRTMASILNPTAGFVIVRGEVCHVVTNATAIDVKRRSAKLRVRLNAER